MGDLLWYVAHTRPRCEKKLAEYCQRHGCEVTLPLYRNVKKYNRKTVTFEKPLFPNYLFLHLNLAQRQTVFQSDHVANLLDVPDQATFEQQLNDILLTLETNSEIILAPKITIGARVKITTGPLRGIEGYVENRSGATYVHLRLDFIGQAVAVKVEATGLELT